ncbi:MAG: hypothetical protein V3T08_09480 [Gemmatimonadota bacterium]
MAFTYDTTTSRGRVRLLVSDTDTADATKQIFTDAEIDAFLAFENNEIYAAAAAACESLAANTARSAILYRAEKLLAIDRKNVPMHFRALAKMYRERSVSAPAEEIDSMDYSIGPFGDDRSEYVGDTV